MARRRQENRVLPHTRQEVAAHQFWQQRPHGVLERWFVQLCIFASAVHDHFITSEAFHRVSAHWCATIHYYSIMHSCRSVLFQCFGDFPYTHASLCKFLDFDGVLRDGQRRPVRIDWLSKFVRQHTLALQARNQQEINVVRQVLDDYLRLELHAAGLADFAQEHGSLVALAKQLREHGSYDALLIANEEGHFLVTHSVAYLCDDLAAASQRFLDFARDALVACLRHDLSLGNDRPRLLAFTHDFLTHRLRPSVESRLSPDNKDAFVQWMDAIELETNDESTTDIWEAVQFGIFDAKTTLMRDYERRIREFGQRLRQAGIPATQHPDLVAGEEARTT